MQICIHHGALKYIDANDNYIKLIFKFKQYKKANIINFVHYSIVKNVISAKRLLSDQW